MFKNVLNSSVNFVNKNENRNENTCENEKYTITKILETKTKIHAKRNYFICSTSTQKVNAKRKCRKIRSTYNIHKYVT